MSVRRSSLSLIRSTILTVVCLVSLSSCARPQTPAVILGPTIDTIEANRGGFHHPVWKIPTPLPKPDTLPPGTDDAEDTSRRLNAVKDQIETLKTRLEYRDDQREEN